jgi:hypothetical protein
MEKLQGSQSYVFRDMTPGMVTSVSDFLTPDNTPRLLENLYTDEADGNHYGNVRGRLGYTIIDAQIVSGKNALGVCGFLDRTGTPDRLVVWMNNSGNTAARAYYVNSSGNFTEIDATTTWTASTKVRTTTFVDYVFAANGSNALRTWNGDVATTWGTTNATSAPIGSLIVSCYDRVIVGNTAGGDESTITRSDLVSSNTISWTGGGTKLPINPDDNDYLTALEFNNVLLCFKSSALYTWSSAGATQADLLIPIGTPTQECVATTSGVTYFIGSNKTHLAAFEYRGEYPREISRPIRNFFDALSLANSSTWTTWTDDDHVFFSVGDVTVNSVAFANMVLRYCISKGSWSVYTLADEMTNRITASQHGTVRPQAGGTRSIVVSDNNGKIYTWNSGTTDNSTPILCRLRTKPLEFGSRIQRKRIQRMVLHIKTDRQVKLMVRVNGETKWTELQRRERVTDSMIVFDVDLEGFTFEFELLVENSDEAFEFEGFEFTDVISYGIKR